MEILHLTLLFAAVVVGVYIIWTWPKLSKPLKYKHPEDAVGVGPKWEEDPQLHYMWIWTEGTRLNMEFRNMPGIIMRCDRRIIPELSESLKKLAEEES